MTHFSFSRMLRRLCLALLAVFCFTSARADDLTKEQLTEAFVAALKEFAEYSSGVDFAIATWPTSDPFSHVVGIAELMMNSDPRFWNVFTSKLNKALEDFLAANPDYSATLADMTIYLQKLAKLDNLSYRDDDALRVYNPDFHFTGAGDLLVHDPGLETAVGELQHEVRLGASSITDGINESNTQLMQLWQQLQDLNGSLFDWYDDWKKQRDAEAIADAASATEYQNAVSEGETAKSDDERDGTDLYERADLPDVEDNYTPSIEENSLGGSDLGLQDVDDDITHSAVVTMVHGSPGGGASIRSSGGIVPRIEWDMGSDSVLVNFATRMGSFVAWLSSTLFLLLLSYKGLHMWRVVRVGFVQAATGNEPTLHLAYNPF